MDSRGVVAWLYTNGITPIPCIPRSKKPAKYLWENEMNRRVCSENQGSYHVPTRERLELIKKRWSFDNSDIRVAFEEENPDDISIAIDTTAGYNSGKKIVCIDVDTDNIGDFKNEPVFQDALIVVGRVGYKIIFFCNDAPREEKKRTYYNGEEHVDVWIGDKRLLFVYGEHEKSTPENSIFYVVIRGYDKPIPNIKWDEVESVLNKLNEYGFSLPEIKMKTPVVFKPKSRGLMARLKQQTLEEFISRVRIEDVCVPHKSRTIGNEIIGSHPIHGSEHGTNLHIDTSSGTWYCFRCEAGGGVPDWIAVEMGLIDCSEAGRGYVRGKVMKQVVDELKRRGYK